MSYERIDLNNFVIDGVTYTRTPTKSLRERFTNVCKDIDCDIPLEDVEVHVDNLMTAMSGFLHDKLADFDLTGSYGEGYSSCSEYLIDSL